MDGLVVLEIILWSLIASGVYSMVGYPLLVVALEPILRKRFVRDKIQPRVSLIISAFNEQAVIATKIENSLGQDYPADRLEIIVASDGSTDRTDEIVRGYESRGVKLLRFDGGMGKSAVLNAVAPLATGDVLVFSDATGMYTPNSVQDLASHFADPRVGAVSGRVGYSFERGLASQGFGFYQKYVRAVRRAEGASGAAILGAGSIHAIRKSLFRPGPPDTFMDMIDPLHSAIQGYCNTFEEAAVSMEEVRAQTREEYAARLRIGLRVWSFMRYSLPRLPLLRSPLFCFQLISHKYLRWLIGPSLPVIFLINLLLLGQGRIYGFLLAGQFVYYGATVAALMFSRLGSLVPGLSGLVFFNATNFAYLVALFRFLRGARATRWVPSR